MTKRLLMGRVAVALLLVGSVGCSSQGMSASRGDSGGGMGDSPRYLTGGQPFDQVININSYGTTQPHRLYLVLTDRSDLPEATPLDWSADTLNHLVLSHAQAAFHEAEMANDPNIEVVFFIRHDPGDSSLGRTATFSVNDLNIISTDTPESARKLVAQRAGNWVEMYLPNQEEDGD